MKGRLVDIQGFLPNRKEGEKVEVIKVAGPAALVRLTGRRYVVKIPSRCIEPEETT